MALCKCVVTCDVRTVRDMPRLGAWGEDGRDADLVPTGIFAIKVLNCRDCGWMNRFSGLEESDKALEDARDGIMMMTTTTKSMKPYIIIRLSLSLLY